MRPPGLLHKTLTKLIYIGLDIIKIYKYLVSEHCILIKLTLFILDSSISFNDLSRDTVGIFSDCKLLYRIRTDAKAIYNSLLP